MVDYDLYDMNGRKIYFDFELTGVDNDIIKCCMYYLKVTKYLFIFERESYCHIYDFGISNLISNFDNLEESDYYNKAATMIEGLDRKIAKNIENIDVKASRSTKFKEVKSKLGTNMDRRSGFIKGNG